MCSMVLSFSITMDAVNSLYLFTVSAWIQYIMDHSMARTYMKIADPKCPWTILKNEARTSEWALPEIITGSTAA